MNIAEMIAEGEAHARTARELAEICGCSIRVITQNIENARRAGVPICATTNGSAPGYYLPATREELAQYCRRLYRRGGELFKTRRALLDVLAQMPEPEEE